MMNLAQKELHFYLIQEVTKSLDPFYKIQIYLYLVDDINLNWLCNCFFPPSVKLSQKSPSLCNVPSFNYNTLSERNFIPFLRELNANLTNITIPLKSRVEGISQYSLKMLNGSGWVWTIQYDTEWYLKMKETSSQV